MTAEQHMQLCLQEHASQRYYAQAREDVKSIEVERVRLDSQGYAPNGQYFGAGARLYVAHFFCELQGAPALWESSTFRAPDYQRIRRELARLYPNATVAR
jgi:hypothetical protein